MSSIDRPLSGDVLRFHLEEERIRVDDPALLEHGRHARTLVKQGPLRVILIMVRAGGKIAAHHADGPITVQVLQGDIQVRVGGREHRLAAGELLVVNTGVEHEVGSDGGGTFLLTVVQPD